MAGSRKADLIPAMAPSSSYVDQMGGVDMRQKPDSRDLCTNAHTAISLGAYQVAGSSRRYEKKNTNLSDFLSRYALVCAY